jgi:hypothetical protein
LVTRCHGGGRALRARAGREGAGALRRFSGGSGDALVIVCVRGCGRGEDQG